MEDITTIIIILICIGNCNCFLIKPTESIFIYGKYKTYCDIMCENTPHTLCEDENVVGPPIPKCEQRFFLYDLAPIKSDIMMGLNGLRDRIADKMQVANMNMLMWDQELALMAHNFLKHCKPFEKNSCTNLGAPVTSGRLTEPRYFHVVENIAYRKYKYLQSQFVTSVLRDWYYEKNNMQKPYIHMSQYDEYYGTFDKHNNFTHLSNPYAIRVGCALARFFDGYTFLCYSYPYFQTKPRFVRGPPATACPNRYPLNGVLFKNLCTHGGVHCKRATKVLIILCTLVTIMWSNTYGYRMFRLRVQGGLIFWQKWNW